MSSDAGLVRYMPGPPNRMDTQVASSTVSFLGIAVWPIRFLFDRWAGPFGLSAFTDVSSLSGSRTDTSQRRPSRCLFGRSVTCVRSSLGRRAYAYTTGSFVPFLQVPLPNRQHPMWCRLASAPPAQGFRRVIVEV
jgi:hypothetical protein